MLTLHLGPLDVNLDEFVRAVKDLVSTDLDDRSKRDMSELIEEVRKTYDTIVDTLTPFYKVRIQSDDKAYVIEFTDQFTAFKTIFRKNSNELRTHCTTIQYNIGKLLENREWLIRIPHKKKPLEDLQKFANEWSRQEVSLADILNGFLIDVNKTLSELNELNSKNLIAESRNALRAFINESDPYILKIKSQLDELKVITARYL